MSGVLFSRGRFLLPSLFDCDLNALFRSLRPSTAFSVLGHSGQDLENGSNGQPLMRTQVADFFFFSASPSPRVRDATPLGTALSARNPAIPSHSPCGLALDHITKTHSGERSLWDRPLETKEVLSVCLTSVVGKGGLSLDEWQWRVAKSDREDVRMPMCRTRGSTPKMEERSFFPGTDSWRCCD